ncbi:unnamed protein product [Phaeothamnion confervicola]
MKARREYNYTTEEGWREEGGKQKRKRPLLLAKIKTLLRPVPPGAAYCHPAAIGASTDGLPRVLSNLHERFARTRWQESRGETFPRQELAFARFDELLLQASEPVHFYKIMAYELAGGGRRGYAVVDMRRFAPHYLTSNPVDNHWYELIREHEPCCMYFDLEFGRRLNPGLDGDALVRLWIAAVAAKLRRDLGIELGTGASSIVDLDSSTDAKFSRHVILHMPDGRLFRDNVHVGRFVHQLVAELQTAADAPAVGNGDDVCPANIGGDLSGIGAVSAAAADAAGAVVNEGVAVSAGLAVDAAGVGDGCCSAATGPTDEGMGPPEGQTPLFTVTVAPSADDGDAPGEPCGLKAIEAAFLTPRAMVDSLSPQTFLTPKALREASIDADGASSAMKGFEGVTASETVQAALKQLWVRTDRGIAFFADTSVYSRNRCFRLLGSCKYGKTAVLKQALGCSDRRSGDAGNGGGRNTHDGSCGNGGGGGGNTRDGSRGIGGGGGGGGGGSSCGIGVFLEAREKLLLDSLVVPVGAPPLPLGKLLTVVGPSCLTRLRLGAPPRDRRSGGGRSGSDNADADAATSSAAGAAASRGPGGSAIGRSTHSTARVGGHGASSPFPSLDAFVLSQARRGGVQGEIRAWHYRPGSGIVTYEMTKNRFCRNNGRPHRSNNVLFEADLRAGALFQRCHDSQCRAAGFRSEAMPLPPLALPSPAVLAELDFEATLAEAMRRDNFDPGKWG